MSKPESEANINGVNNASEETNGDVHSEVTVNGERLVSKEMTSNTDPSVNGCPQDVSKRPAVQLSKLPDPPSRPPNPPSRPIDPPSRTVDPPNKLQEKIPNPPPRPVFNHVGYVDSADSKHGTTPDIDCIPRIHQHHQRESGSRSHLTSGDKVIQSRNRRRSFAGESSLEREEPTSYSRESLVSNSHIYDAQNTYDGSKIPSYERRTGSMGRRDSYGERRRFRDQSYNEESPALRRNFSYGSDIENYGVYDQHKSFERMSRRDMQDGSRGRHPGRNYSTQDNDSFRREVYQELARRYERSQSATRLGYTEDPRGGYDNIYPQKGGGGYARPGGYAEDLSRRYSEVQVAGRDQTPPYYAAPKYALPAVRFDMPIRFPGPSPQYPGE